MNETVIDLTSEGDYGGADEIDDDVILSNNSDNVVDSSVQHGNVTQAMAKKGVKTNHMLKKLSCNLKNKGNTEMITRRVTRSKV